MRRLFLAAFLVLCPLAADASRLFDMIRAGGAEVNPKGPYAAAVLALNPTMYWRLGESGGTIAEEENGDFDGTYTNGPTLGATSLVPNSANSAVSFASASSQYVVTAATNLGTTWSVICWINTSTTAAFQIPFHALEISGVFNGMALQIAQTTGYLQGVTCDDVSSCDTWASTTNVADGVDHMLAATFGVGGSASLYVDGSVVASFSGRDIISAATTPASNDIGRRADGFYMNGVIDDVTVWVDEDIGATTISDLWGDAQ